jgi:protocatechuate 3,4-dioxygenase beta subunit
MLAHPDHDDRHDRGLRYDLAAMRRLRPLRLERRRALALFGGAGLGLLVAACSSGSSGTSAAGSTSSTAAGSSSTLGATGSTAATGAAVTEAIPEETAGPYPGDGSNGPNVLDESGVVRRDIRSSFGEHSGTAEGEPFDIDLTIVEAGSGTPMEGAAVYLWHCDAEGGYSLYSEGVTDQNYLRGVQAADAAGNLGFTSIFPGAYSGRWPHIHFEVYPSLDDAAAGDQLVTSQIALPEDVCVEVYDSSTLYRQSVTNLARTSLESDGIFRDGYDLQLPTTSGSIGSGLSMALTVAV